MSTPPAILLSLLAALIPTLVYTLLVWWLDRYEREPWRLIASAFVWGAAPAIALAILLEHALGLSLAAVQPQLLQDVAIGGLLAPAIEELTKGLALLMLFVLARSEFDTVLDGIVYGAVIGFGFAMTENFLYFLEILGSARWARWTSVVALRSLLFGFNHAFYTAVIGAGFGLAAVAPSPRWRWAASGLGIVLAIAFHAVHNVGVMLSQTNTLALAIAIVTDWGGIALLLVIILLVWRQERLWIATELLTEVGYILSPAEYAAASRYGRRLAVWFETLRRGGWRAAQRRSRLHHLLAELAFHKRRLRGQTDSQQLRGEIEQIRSQILDLRKEIRT